MDERATSWQQNNERYLAASLKWLRRRLRRMADEGLDPTIGAQPEPASGGLFGFLRRRPELPARAGTSGLASQPTSEEEEALRYMDEAAEAELTPALITLSRRLDLSQFEKELLFLCAAMELDTRIPHLCARAQDDDSRPFPTFALALALFDNPSWDALSPARPLRFWRLIEINQPGAQSLTTSALRADERIVNYIKGLEYIDDRLAPLLAPLEGATETLPPSQAKSATWAAHYVKQAIGGRLPVIQLLGADAPSKAAVAHAAAAELGLHIYRLPAEVLPNEPGQLEQIARLWHRESVLLPLALYVDVQEADESAATAPWQRFLAGSEGVFFLGTREMRAGLGAAAAVEVARPTPPEQQMIWDATLAGAPDDVITGSPRLLAGQFDLNALAIRRIARAALADAADANAPLTHNELWRACLNNTRPRLDLLAQRIEPKATWDHIVLPGEVEQTLHQLADQVAQRHTVYDDWGFREKLSRGLGISALFSGESGTGKTMAAEVLANELRLNLYRIDLSGVISKYIGETEKNLRRLFDAAEEGGAILFFDESDALFGKRSQVKDSHDRYANIEVNYLLQRMEAYGGLAILATNRPGDMDRAFQRRIRFDIPFPFPDAALREEIWRRIFPPQTPVRDLDYAALGRQQLTGGSINNIALNAAFLAAAAGEPVMMAHIYEATRAELHKLKRPVRESDFRLAAVN